MAGSHVRRKHKRKRKRKKKYSMCESGRCEHKLRCMCEPTLSCRGWPKYGSPKSRLQDRKISVSSYVGCETSEISLYCKLWARLAAQYMCAAMKYILRVSALLYCMNWVRKQISCSYLPTNLIYQPSNTLNRPTDNKQAGR